jgi:hypothetical protein
VPHLLKDLLRQQRGRRRRSLGRARRAQLSCLAGEREQVYWRWNLLRSYFDNNQSSPPALWHDVDNVIHVASHSDYLDPDPTCWEPDAPRRSGMSGPWLNFSEIYKDHVDTLTYLPVEWRQSVWVHELMHQFYVNDCDPLDHSVEEGPTVYFGLPGVCLMNSSAGSPHGPYLGVGSAVPNTTGATVPRNTSCWSGQGDWKFVRYQHRLNESP